MPRLCLLIITFLLITQFNLCHCQTYLDNNPLWRVISECAVNEPGCLSHNDYNYYINGDTVIDSHYYKKLYMFGYGYYTWNSPPPVPFNCQGSFIISSNVAPFKFIRDTLGIIYLYGIPEQCIYDFNLSVGDTLPLCYGNSDQTILSIDSILVDGNFRKQFHLSSQSGGQSQVIVEGIGHEHGFLEGLPPLLECANNLVCYSVNDTAYFPVGHLSCQSPNSINNLTQNDLLIYPFPARDHFYIESNGIIIKNLLIFDMLGKAIEMPDVQNIRSGARINLPNLTDGYYLLSIVTNNGRVVKPLTIINR